MRSCLVICILLLLGLGGCAQKSPFEASPAAPTIQRLEATNLPTPAGISGKIRPYVIGPYDRLKIDVFGVPEISNAEIQTDASGHVSIPLAGEIDAAGKTPGELAANIEARLARYIRDPQVAVNLIETLSQVVTVDGQVKRPGLYPVIGEMTLMRAVARAEGLADLAQPSEVVVFRNVNGQQYAGLYDLRAIRQGSYEDPEIFADDIVIVGESSQRRMLREFLPVVSALVSPLIYLIRNN